MRDHDELSLTGAVRGRFPALDPAVKSEECGNFTLSNLEIRHAQIWFRWASRHRLGDRVGSAGSALVTGSGVEPAPRFGPLEGVTSRVSLGPGGAQANDESLFPAVSADGRYVAFATGASNLVPRDTNDAWDVFVRDRVAHVTERVWVGPGSAQTRGGSGYSAISADGRYVAFASEASNLVPGDTNDVSDIFVRDRVAHVTERVWVRTSGAQANLWSYEPEVSPAGRYVVFYSGASNLGGGSAAACSCNHRQVTRLVSVGLGGAPANGQSRGAVVSAGGRYVAFHSEASNLVAGDTNDEYDVFVRDRVAQVTRRVSVGPGGAQANHHSYDPTMLRGRPVRRVLVVGVELGGRRHQQYPRRVRVGPQHRRDPAGLGRSGRCPGQQHQP